MQQRILLAVNEVLANILRHADRTPSEIMVDFIDHNGELFCVICDDSDGFDNFDAYWEVATLDKNSFHIPKARGLGMIKNLWPKAFYVKRSDAYHYNSFILPLDVPENDTAPEFFRPTEKAKDWTIQKPRNPRMWGATS